MKIIKTKIKDLYLFKSQTHMDKRGFLRETFKKNIIKNVNFKFDIISFSKKNVLRGMHIQTLNPQAKFLTVTYGKIFDVVVDLRKNSKTFGKYMSWTLSDKDNFSIYIPKGFAHGYLCLSKYCSIYYKCSNYRNKKYEKSISWNDKSIKIKWPIKKPILSRKDATAHSLNEFIKLKK